MGLLSDRIAPDAHPSPPKHCCSESRERHALGTCESASRLSSLFRSIVMTLTGG